MVIAQIVLLIMGIDTEDGIMDTIIIMVVSLVETVEAVESFVGDAYG